MTEGAVSQSSGKGMQIALYVVSGLLTALFLFASSGKLMSNPQAVEGFVKYGYNDAFRFFIGACELAGAIGLWLPRLAFWAAMGLLLIMLGAIGTHVTNGEGPWGAAVAAVLLGFVAWRRMGTALFLA